MKIKIISMLFALAMVPVAQAQDGSVDFHGKTPTDQELIEALTPSPEEAPAKRGYKTRAIRPVKVEAPKAVSLEINFEKNSAAITETSAQTLDTLGKALKSDRLTTFHFIIEGHTDASGTADYNLNLSEQRAAAVKSYLVNNFSIEPARLETLGKGEQELLDTDDPLGGRNRRVKIINSGN